jgi:hypothetical protein
MVTRRRDQFGFDVIPNDMDTVVEQWENRRSYKKISPKKSLEEIIDFGNSDDILHVMNFATPEEKECWNKEYEIRCAHEQAQKERIEKARAPQTKIGETIFCTYCGRATNRNEFHGDHILFSKARRCESCKTSKQPRPINLFCRCCGKIIPQNDNDGKCAWMCVSCKSK